MPALRRFAGTALAVAALCLTGTAVSGTAAAASDDPSYPTYWCMGAGFDAENGTIYGWVPCVGPRNQTGPGWVKTSGDALYWCESVTYTYGGPLSPVRFVSATGCRLEPTGEPAA